MTKMIVAVIAACALLVPVAAIAADDVRTVAAAANEICKQEQVSLAGAFNSTYGTNASKSNAFGKCVAKNAKNAKAALDNASKACAAEWGADPTAFASKYGKNANDKNAFGRCVSQHAQATEQAQQQATIAAAAKCSAERKSLGDAAFKTKYGTNANKSNAFGKCVAKYATTK